MVRWNKYLDSAFVRKEEATGLADGLQAGYEKREVKIYFSIFALNKVGEDHFLK